MKIGSKWIRWVLLLISLVLIMFVVVGNDSIFDENISFAQGGDDWCCGYNDPDTPYVCGCGTGNCSWWAHYRFNQSYPNDQLPDDDWGYPYVGTTCQWCNEATAAGFTVNGNVAANTIAIFHPSGACAFADGHVAYVESYEGNILHISEMNWCGAGDDECMTETDYDLTNCPTTMFIHGVGDPQPTPTPEPTATPVPAPDLTLITDVMLDPTQLVAGNSVAFSFQVQNQGDAAQHIDQVDVSGHTGASVEFHYGVNQSLPMDVQPTQTVSFSGQINVPVDDPGGTWNIEGLGFRNGSEWFPYDQGGHNFPYGFSVSPAPTPTPTPVPDTTPPGVWILDPSPASLLKGNQLIRMQVEDESAVTQVMVAIYYKEWFGEPQEAHNVNATQVSDNIWELNYDFYQAGQRALAQNGAWMQVTAWDEHGNQGQSGQLTFKIYYQLSRSVDADKSWDQLTQWWVNKFPVPLNGTVQVQYQNGTAYSAPSQPQSPNGDGGVCLDITCDYENTSKALVGRYVHFSIPERKNYTFVGSQYSGLGLRDGSFEMVMNDDSYTNNSGEWNVLLTVYPPNIVSVLHQTVEIRELATCGTNRCPHVSLWFESDGVKKKAAEWTAENTTWQTHSFSFPEGLITYPNGIDRVWVVYDNDTSAVDYHIRWVKVNGTVIYVTDPSVTYCKGSDYVPFQETNCVSGQEDMFWNGAMRFPF